MGPAARPPGRAGKTSTAFHPFHTDAQVKALSSAEELAPFLVARLEQINHGSSARGLFADAWQDAYDEAGARRSVATALSGVDLAPSDLCTYLYLHEYHPRLTVPSLEVFREVSEVRLPLADPDFIECVFQDSAWRSGTRIHQELIRRINPAFLRVRNPNTGAPAGAGPLQEFVLDKLNSVLRRLNVYGYRHYHSFDGWMRAAFIDVIDTVLLSPPALDRGLVREFRAPAISRRSGTGLRRSRPCAAGPTVVELSAARFCERATGCPLSVARSAPRAGGTLGICVPLRILPGVHEHVSEGQRGLSQAISECHVLRYFGGYSLMGAIRVARRDTVN